MEQSIIFSQFDWIIHSAVFKLCKLKQTIQQDLEWTWMFPSFSNEQEIL